MFKSIRKKFGSKKCQLKAKPLAVKWYPSHRNFAKLNLHDITPHEMPPLMVKKAAWRR